MFRDIGVHGAMLEARARRLTERLKEWVEREMPKDGERPTQEFLRRRFILEYVSEPDFREALAELEAVEREVGEE